MQNVNSHVIFAAIFILSLPLSLSLLSLLFLSFSLSFLSHAWMETFALLGFR